MRHKALLLAGALCIALNASGQSPETGTSPSQPSEAPNPGQSSATKQQQARQEKRTRKARASQPAVRDQAKPNPSNVSAGTQKTYRDRKKLDAGTACSTARTTPEGRLDCGMSGKAATSKPKPE
jgi:hypothetical protein